MQTNGYLNQPDSSNNKLSLLLKIRLPALAMLIIGGVSAWAYSCPCERTPGIYLSGERVEQPVTDWSFANQVELCQIQTRSGIISHAINLNCMAGSNGELFLSCAQCDGKRWSTAALLNPEGYVRLDGLVYPVNFAKLEDESELENAWHSRALKLATLRGTTTGEIAERPAHWWSFRVSSRT